MSVRSLKREESERVEQIKGFVEFCFDVLTVEMSECMKGISNRTGLCMATLYRLKRGGFTSAVRFGTIQRLGRAANAKLAIVVEQRQRKTARAA